MGVQQKPEALGGKETFSKALCDSGLAARANVVQTTKPNVDGRRARQPSLPPPMRPAKPSPRTPSELPGGRTFISPRVTDRLVGRLCCGRRCDSRLAWTRSTTP